jgi:hypothetical protein
MSRPKKRGAYEGASLACSCGGSAKFIDWRSKRFVSLLGEVRLSRTYYYCSACSLNQLPWDRKVGLTKRRITPGAAELATMAGTLASFPLAVERALPRMSGLRLSESTVQRVTEDAGQRLGEKLAAKETFGPDESWQWQRDADGHRCAYLSVDHTGVPQQAADGGKAEGRMAAVAMVFNARSEFEKQPSKDPHQVRYLAGFHDLDELGLQWRRQAAQVGWDQAERQLALTDGGRRRLARHLAGIRSKRLGRRAAGMLSLAGAVRAKQRSPHGLSHLPRTRLDDRLGFRRSGLQVGDRPTPQRHGNAVARTRQR